MRRQTVNQMLASLNHSDQLVSLATYAALSIVPSPLPFATAFITCCTRSTSRAASDEGSGTASMKAVAENCNNARCS